uniref:Serpin domain-containing protein n=1 Tax=Oryza brachyantha TaxID=4533 RepID=J3N712_ORYBR
MAVEVRHFMLPKFKFTFSDDMAGVLHGLGLELTFSDVKADLSNMVGDDGSGSGRTLWMNRVVHKAVIEVNEEGTEAASLLADARCGMSMSESPPPVRVDFVADHPFAFFVIEVRGDVGRRRLRRPRSGPQLTGRSFGR